MTLEELQEYSTKKLRTAYSLGKTWWQQADSEYRRENKKADETDKKFEELIDSTIAAITFEMKRAADGSAHAASRSLSSVGAARAVLSDEQIKEVAINYAQHVAADIYDVTKYDCAEDFFNCVRACVLAAAEPEEPYNNATHDKRMEFLRGERERLADAPAPTAAQQEPVAYLDLSKFEKGPMVYATNFRSNDRQTALYAVAQAPDSQDMVTRIREAILTYYDALTARQHGGVAQGNAISAIEQVLGISWQYGIDHRAAMSSPSNAPGSEGGDQ